MHIYVQVILHTHHTFIQTYRSYMHTDHTCTQIIHAHRSYMCLRTPTARTMHLHNTVRRSIVHLTTPIVQLPKSPRTPQQATNRRIRHRTDTSTRRCRRPSVKYHTRRLPGRTTWRTRRISAPECTADPTRRRLPGCTTRLRRLPGRITRLRRLLCSTARIP